MGCRVCLSLTLLIVPSLFTQLFAFFPLSAPRPSYLDPSAKPVSSFGTLLIEPTPFFHTLLLERLWLCREPQQLAQLQGIIVVLGLTHSAPLSHRHSDIGIQIW
jgi:hypothetical protein